MIVYDVATKVLDTESFPLHNMADLSSGITSIVSFSQEQPLRWKEINTHRQPVKYQHDPDGNVKNIHFLELRVNN